MATGPKIVHKQFNSPIGLYSRQNIQETLNKHIQNLDNGSVGIDFQNPATGKPANLANSAVLRMLEEEERNRKGLPSQKKVVWPPAPETNGYHSPQQTPAYNNVQSQQQFSPQPQTNQFSPQTLSNQYQDSYETYQAPPQQPQNQYPQSPAQNQPGYCEGRRQAPTGLSKLIPVSPGATSPASPQYRQGPLSPSAQPYRQQQSRWAPVPAPISPQPTAQSPQYPSQPQYSPQSQQYSQPEYSEPVYQPPQKQFEPPPSLITLRPQPPIHQTPSPVFSSQPAAASFKGGINMRGDMKWPPQSVKEAVAAENEARVQLAKGPACRPRKVKKDYSSFFSQHALNHCYTSYRVPPGTQHFDDHSGRSSY
ncbi:uncharacterized protein LOC126967085 isoform X4 [Leptidea sinapis]|uniref:uncharacterized protein LOC126967085 isoform X4 n=1 Tax=Leptidea sinapis TaxID=189913 RepID=UPI0021C265D2|nr:uncharacterized protein LOC126967085 isoform X4 [Leptidea sinapis]